MIDWVVSGSEYFYQKFLILLESGILNHFMREILLVFPEDLFRTLKYLRILEKLFSSYIEKNSKCNRRLFCFFLLKLFTQFSQRPSMQWHTF